MMLRAWSGKRHAFCSGEYDLGHVTDDCSNSVDLEEIKMYCFVAAGCKCKLANGNSCSQLFSASMYRSLRDECHALTQDELDLVVMGSSELWCITTK